MADSSQKHGLDPLSLPHANFIPARSVKLLDHVIRVPHAEVRKARYNGSEVCAKVLHLVGSLCEQDVCERVSRRHTIEYHESDVWHCAVVQSFRQSLDQGGQWTRREDKELKIK